MISQGGTKHSLAAAKRLFGDWRPQSVNVILPRQRTKKLTALKLRTNKVHSYAQIISEIAVKYSNSSRKSLN